MKNTVHPTASTSLRTLEGRSFQLSPRTAQLDDECAATGGTGGLCVHCTGPESD
ncbi:hypothetical protein ACH9D2_10110 [Kocuria sp. M4R2S49]|uniref:hypothetical protein n=1 Tax=Kocuria rhizosphaericola TaxID=3376284 RepID=UPI003788DF54